MPALWTAKSRQSHASPMSDASPTWEVERQKMQDHLQELKKKCSNLEGVLRQTQDESARRAQAVDASEDKIEDLRMDKSALLRRAIEAENRAAQLAEQVELLRCGQPGPSTSTSSSRTNPPSSLSRPHASAPFIDLSASDEDDGATPHRSQRASGATGTRSQPQKRTEWVERDANLLMRLIGLKGPKYSKLEVIWKQQFPNRHPRDQGQLKDKARNLKIWMLK